MAYLQRVINCGGSIDREMASGRGRLDLCVNYDGERYPIELKLLRGEKTYKEGKQQLADYLKTLGEKEGWLVVFDRRPEISWDEKLFCRDETLDTGESIYTVGC